MASDFAEDFLPVWQRAEAYLLAVAEAMPEEQYSYRPTKRVFTFSEQLLHTANNLNWLTKTYLLEEPMDNTGFRQTDTTKAAVISYVKEAMAKVTRSYHQLETEEENQSVILFNGLNTNKRRVFLLMRDHMTHHRAQLILYLRMNGIEPPPYVGW